MRIFCCLRILGLLLVVYSFSHLPPVAVAMYYHEGGEMAFILAFILTFMTGLALWLPFANHRRELRTRDGFLIVTMFWSVLCLFSSLPFIIATVPDISFTDAVFEAVSGLTTTGATVLSGLDNMPRSILYYRQQMQFFGGMGIIVLAVAVLPMLGIGGMQMFRAEITGPVKESKFTPRIAETAKLLWLVYVGLTILCALFFWLGGMSLFDAIGYAFGTVSTGGYAPHDASMGYYPSHFLQSVCCVFMVLGAVSFSLHFIAMKRLSIKPYRASAECRLYGAILVSAIVACWLVLVWEDHNENSVLLLEQSVFHILSLATTTGFSSADYSLWPTFLPMLLLFMGLIGGCAGSTSGGVKVIRILLLWKQARRELHRLIHPDGQFLLKVDKQIVPGRISDAVWGYISIYMALFLLLVLLLLATDLDLTTAYSCAIASLANIGPGLGDISDNYASIPSVAKWITIAAMLIGRLEVFSVLVLFSPQFWRR